MHPAVADVLEPPAPTSPTPSRGSAPARPPRRFLKWGLIAALVLVVLFGGGLGAAYAYDSSTSDRFLPGVRVADVDVEGQEPAAVVAQIDARFRAEGSKRIQVTAQGGKAKAEPSLDDLGLKADTAAVVAKAVADEREMGTLNRVWHRLLGRPVHRNYPVRFRIEQSRASEIVARLAKDVDRKAEDARIDTSSGLVSVIPAVPGQALDQKVGESRLVELAERLANEASGDGATGAANSSINSSIEVPVGTVQPKVTNFADIILIRTNENRLYHYENGALVRTYTVATGTAQYPTPKGRFTIVLKRFRPTWVNPDPGGWGASLPASIPPGPGNPLGTRALNLNAPGIRIHGTSNVGSLGTNASHGCIRMSIPESEALFDRVEQGTPVIIIPGPPPARPAPVAAPSSAFNPAAPVDLEAG